MIVAQVLTDANVDDATTGVTLIEAVASEISSVTADAAYDTIAFYESAGARDAQVVVPPATTATVSRRGPRSSARDRTIKKVKEIGRRRWKKASAYHQQARVENAFFRYKSIFGGALRARSPGGQVAEALVACNVLNHMTDLGRPESTASVGDGVLGWDRCGSTPIHAPTPFCKVADLSPLSHRTVIGVSAGSGLGLRREYVR